MAESGQTNSEHSGLQRQSPAKASGASEQALAKLSALWQRFMAMPPTRRGWLVALMLFLTAGALGMMWFAQRPDWRMLFSGLEGKDVQQVLQELSAAGIPYELTADGGGVQVPAESLDKARMEVAAKGMPQTGRLGFELFDKPNWVGSEFDERVNYQRALEGELEHTIGTIGAVRSARVHLVLPQQSLFSGEQRAAKASVVLKLRRSTMDLDQAEAIRSLVAGSVENLNPDQVTLVDADGRVSLKPRSKDAADGDMELALETKLVAMLEPLAGRDNVRATVNVSYDQDAEERTDEVYDPTQVVAISMQKSDQSSVPASKAQGIPGTASNSPAASPAGAAAGSSAAVAPGTPPLLQKEGSPVFPQGGGANGQTLHQENGTYAVTKHTTHSALAPGRVRRVTAAVVVNDRATTQGEGKAVQTVWKPRGADEMHRLEQLAQAAVGFDAKRGDQVVIQNVGFSTNTPEVKTAGVERAMDEARSVLHAEPGLARAALVGLCGLLLVMFVLKPVARQINATLKEPLPLMAGQDSLRLAGDAGRGTGIQSASNEFSQPPRLNPVDSFISAGGAQSAVFAHVSEHIRREPSQSTRLLESWIGDADDGRENS